MASLYFKDENGAYQPLSVKLLGVMGGGKTYMHFISAGIYDKTDNDIGGSCTLVVTTSSQEEICGAAESKLIDFFKKIGATQAEWAYPIAMWTNGYTATEWSGIFYDPTDGGLKAVSPLNQGGTGVYNKLLYISTMKEAVIEM